MRRVVAVVGGVRVGVDPGRLIGSVVEHNVAQTEHAPLVLHLVHQVGNIVVAAIKCVIQRVLIPQRVRRVRAPKSLKRQTI